MVLYRIGNCNYINDLSGTGSRLYGGRWNSIGRPMVYMAGSVSLALLEVLVHITPAWLPLNVCVAQLQLPDEEMFEIKTNQLPTDWQDPSPPLLLQELGDQFLAKKDFLLMKVPSVIIPKEFNYLMNPLHPEAHKVKVLNAEPFSFDNRLF